MSSEEAHGTIKLLPRELRDQIAAGEVVERPASVVKELVENAFDADARSVRIEIDGGGLDRIAIIDDGHGMSRDDALLAFERHATSKLARFDDLFALSTFGFRGEALPSIASVSRMRLTTRRAQDLEATEIESNGGSSPVARDVGAPTGTSIEVRDLFFNVPARRKFLKAVATESAHVADAALQLALCRPDVALTLVRDGRVAREFLRATDRRTRAHEAVAKGNDDLAWVVADRPRVHIEALLSPPDKARSGAVGLHLVVNNRVVRDRQLARAVAMAYGSILDPGRYPLGVVYVDVPAADVDVNVHPQKAEVRFSRGRELYDEVMRALGTALAGAFRGPRQEASFLDSRVAAKLFTPAEPPSSSSAPTLDPAPQRAADKTLVGFAMRELSAAMAQQRGAVGERPRVRAGSLDARSDSAPPTIVSPPPTHGDGPRPSAEAAPLASHPIAQGTTLVSFDAATVSRLGALLPTPAGRYGSLRFLAQVRATYLLCEGPEGILVIDQHAAAERVSFDRLRLAYEAGDVARQQLLVPEIVAVSGVESALVEEAREAILKLGIDARAIGDGRVAVHGVPALLRRHSPAELIRDLLDELSRDGTRRFGDAWDKVLATMACHGSVRAGDPMHREEVEALLRALDAVDFAMYCPHGRPIVSVLTYSDLEKKVGRR